MKTADKVYVIFCTLFSALVILVNLTYRKYVNLHVPFHSFELSVGAIIYPLTFVVTDLVAEFYGEKKASFCVSTAIAMNIMIAIIVAIMDRLSATHWSYVDDAMFHTVFGFFGLSVVGSMISCYIAQKIDIFLYLWIRKATKGKYLWLRNNGSTSISLFFDTLMVNTFMVIFNIFPAEQIWNLIGNSYTWKLLFTICWTPIFCLAVKLLRPIFARPS